MNLIQVLQERKDNAKVGTFVHNESNPVIVVVLALVWQQLHVPTQALTVSPAVGHGVKAALMSVCISEGFIIFFLLS